MKNAAVWRAVAAAARRAAWERAVWSLVLQSGRMSSLVTTSGALRGSIVRRFQDGETGGEEDCNEPPREVDEELLPTENGDARAAPGWPMYEIPRRHGGGEYVTPKSVCLQKGQVAGSDTSWSATEFGSELLSPGAWS
jgi:hypothetical protein